MAVISKTPRKSCPFCGCVESYASAITIRIDPMFTAVGGTIKQGSVMCKACGARIIDEWGNNHDDETDREKLETIVDKWNLRAADSVGRTGAARQDMDGRAEG